MAQEDFGNLQILISASDYGATGADGLVASYPVHLAGTYKLTLQGLQVHIHPTVTEANTFPLEIYSPQFIYPVGNTTSFTILYPITAADKYQGSFDQTITANLSSLIQIQLRRADTKAALADLKYAVLNFYYERI